MAEAALFSIVSKLLSATAPPAFERAFEKACSIRNAKDELAKLRRTIRTIQAVLLDAEKKHGSSAVVKDMIKRLRDVLYDADDLFDEVTFDDMLRQQIKGNKLLQKVRLFCSKLNPIVSDNSIAGKAKAIRKSLIDIYADMGAFGFVSCDNEAKIPTGTRRVEEGSFVDPKDVIGRDNDKKVILEMLLNEPDDAKLVVPIVMSIVGIGGMRKTTLAQFVYHDDEVINKFERRWFACISDTLDEKEILGKIYQSMWDENYSSYTITSLKSKIKASITGRKFLLVLDDVWDEDRGSWKDRMNLLEFGAHGSKIIVTTRSSAVARAMGTLKTYKIGGLSAEHSWDLFKKVRVYS